MAELAQGSGSWGVSPKKKGPKVAPMALFRVMKTHTEDKMVCWTGIRTKCSERTRRVATRAFFHSIITLFVINPYCAVPLDA